MLVNFLCSDICPVNTDFDLIFGTFDREMSDVITVMMSRKDCIISCKMNKSHNLPPNANGMKFTFLECSICSNRNQYVGQTSRRPSSKRSWATWRLWLLNPRRQFHFTNTFRKLKHCFTSHPKFFFLEQAAPGVLLVWDFPSFPSFCFPIRFPD